MDMFDSIEHFIYQLDVIAVRVFAFACTIILLIQLLKSKVKK